MPKIVYNWLGTGINPRCMKPTLKHRPAIWECMLGTVYAMRQTGPYQYESEYFDYDWEAAFEWAGVDNDSDPRLYKNKRRVSWTGADRQPSYNRLVLWIQKEE